MLCTAFVLMDRALFELQEMTAHRSLVQFFWLDSLSIAHSALVRVVMLSPLHRLLPRHLAASPRGSLSQPTATSGMHRLVSSSRDGSKAELADSSAADAITDAIRFAAFATLCGCIAVMQRPFSSRRLYQRSCAFGRCDSTRLDYR